MVAKSKPFIAARVPEGLNEALEKHVNDTGENRTTAIINALSFYLKWSDSKETKPNSTVDRLSLLEKRVAALEDLTKPSQSTQASQMELVIDSDNTDNSDNNNQTESGLDWITLKEAHAKYCDDRSYDGFRRLKPEQFKENYGLEADPSRKKGKMPHRWLRKLVITI